VLRLYGKGRINAGEHDQQSMQVAVSQAPLKVDRKVHRWETSLFHHLISAWY
jgi:hypothetical protein